MSRAIFDLEQQMLEFANGIPPEQLAVIENLRVIPWQDDLARNRSTKSS
jgi:hypothetical protein